MRILRNRTLVAVILVLVMSVFVLIMITPDVKAEIVTTWVEALYASPDPGTVGDPVLLTVDIGPDPPSGSFYYDIQFRVTEPDGTEYYSLYVDSDASGVASFTYWPDKIGSHFLSVVYGGGYYGSDFYRGCSGGPIEFIVQENGNEPPVADANGPYTGIEGVSVTFDGSGSYDPDGTIVNYEWDFGDGNTGTGVAPSHTYTKEGIYTVTLTVTDDYDLIDTDTTTATISDVGAGHIVFEEAHSSVFTIGSNPAYETTGGYSEFANYLIANGYGVSTINPGTTIDAGVLAPVDVLVIVAPQNSYSTAEIDAIETWVEGGGRLLLISDWSSYGAEANTIATRFSITLELDRILDTDENVGYEDWPYYDGSNLLSHPITAGVTRVEMYASDGITSGPTDEIPLIVTDTDGTATWYYGGSSALGVSVMSALDGGTAGSGKLIVITDCNLWDSANNFDDDGDLNFYDSDNEVLALNAINWLSTAFNEPPVASFTYSPESPVYTDVVISFDASGSYDPDGSIVSYDWDFGDDYTGSGVTVSHSYGDEGVYTVTLTVTDNNFETAVTNVDITVLNRPPVAFFTENATTVDTGEAIFFDASGSNDPDGIIVSYSWDFGDGNTGSGVTVTHSYVDDGTYTVTLTVTDDDGATDTIISTKTVLNRLPVASFTESAETVYTGEIITFDASDSYDPDGSIVSYFWDFGDGTNATGITVEHTYADDGDYTVALTVTDNDGATDTATATKTIINRPPVAIFTESTETAYIGETITFNASNSYDPDGSIVTYFWDFGDGTTTTGVIVEHAYSNNGTYTVTLTVIDDDSASGSTSSTKTILQNETPVATFTESAETVYTSEIIYFNASDSYDLDGYIVSYFWDFGDGTSTTGLAVNHAYVDDGVYTVTLTVTDDRGATSSTSATKTILNRPPIASFTESAETVHTGESITFNATESYDPDGTIIEYFWDFGDGTNTTGVVVDHAYTDNGTYTVTLTITDDNGATNSATSTKYVVNNSPYQPQLLITPSLVVEDNDDLVVTVTGPTPADPDGDSVTYTYRWLVDAGTGQFVDDELAGRGDHTGNKVPAADTAVGDIWKVEVTPIDEHGAIGPSATATWQMVVDATNPVADAGPDQTVDEGTLVTFDGSGSTDNVGIVSYTWTFTDVTPQTLTGVNPTYTFTTSGTYIVTLNVTDAAGNWDTDTVTITIKVMDATKPEADAGPDQTIVEDTAVSFDAGDSSDNVGIVAYEWDFGDESTGTGKTVTHTYKEPGTYTVKLTVKDAAGNSDTDSIIITVQLDTDGDGTPDITDTDDDNDGVNDDEDAFPLDPTETVDTDGDDIGNNADTDDDNDEVPDAQDAFPLDSLESLDTDGDGIGNNADTDDDNDDVLDDDDTFPLDSSESTDTDADGIGNNADTDDDGDGIPDVWEIENGLDPLDAQDASLDPDNDGLTSLQEYMENKDPNVYDAEAIRQPRSVYLVAQVAVVATAATAATAALASLGGLGQAFNSAVSKLPIPDKLKDFLQLYGEKIFETVDKVKLETLEKAPFITKGDLVALGISALAMTIVFGFVEANGLPSFLKPSVLAAVIPAVLISVCLVSIAGEVSEALCARTCRVYRQYRLWMYGLGAFLISGLLFLFPFASPGITRYQSEEISNKTKGLIVLSKMLILLTLTIPFAGLYMLGFKIIGDAGLLLTLMTVCYSLVPLKPIAGKAVFDYRKEVSFIALVSAGILFYSCIVNLLPHVTYLAAGVVSAFLAAITLSQLRKVRPK